MADWLETTRNTHNLNRTELAVTLYRPDGPCNQCHATKLHLKREGIPFNEVIADDVTIARLRNEGHSSFPVVVAVNNDQRCTFSGYRRDEIMRLSEMMK